MNWQECQEEIQDFRKHYSMTDPQHEIMWSLASQLPFDSTVLELGVCNGRTFAILLYCAKHLGHHLYGVDTFQLQKPETEDDTYEEVITKLNKISHEYVIFKQDTRELNWFLPLDLLIVDAGHDEANVKPDCEKYVPLVKRGGLVAFHDFPPNDSREDAHWAVRFYGNLATLGWEEVTYYGGLMIKRRPA